MASCLWGAPLLCTAATVAPAPESVAAPAAVAAPALAPLEAGVRAYRAGDFNAALQLFLQARTQNPNSGAVLFNVGLSYYRLEKFAAARRAFLALRARPDMSAVAEYHLGLVAARVGQTDRAAAHLRAAAAGDSDALRRLARTALARLGGKPEGSEPAAYASAGLGFDSNRNRISDSIQIAGQDSESVYAELSGVAQYPVRRLNNVDLRATAFQRDYETDDVLDQKSLQVSLRKAWYPGQWRINLGFDSNAAYLRDNSRVSAVGLNLEGIRRVGESTLRLRYQPSVVNADSDYAFLDGDRHRAELSQELRIGKYLVRAGYEAESSDQRAFTADDTFYGQPPLRHGPFLRIGRTFTPRINVDINAAYRHSRYRDLVVPLPVNGRRVEDLAYVGVALRWRVAAAWSLRLNYSYSDNRSNVDIYDHKRQTGLLALEWRY